MFYWTSNQPQLDPTCLCPMRSCTTGCSSTPVDLVSQWIWRVRNYILSHKQAQSTQFKKANRAHALPELTPGQEVLFRSLVDSKYIPRTIINKATMPYSYYLDAQGKRYHRTREHLWPIHPNLPPAQHCLTHTPSLTYPTSLSLTPCPNTFPKHYYQDPHQNPPVKYPIHSMP